MNLKVNSLTYFGAYHHTQNSSKITYFSLKV